MEEMIKIKPSGCPKMIKHLHLDAIYSVSNNLLLNSNISFEFLPTVNFQNKKIKVGLGGILYTKIREKALRIWQLDISSAKLSYFENS